MSKETSDAIAASAARLMTMTDAEFAKAAVDGAEKTSEHFAAIRSVAASALVQHEKDKQIAAMAPKGRELRIVLDGLPGPESGRLIELEDEHGRSKHFGAWLPRQDGLYEMRIPLDGRGEAERLVPRSAPVAEGDT